MCTCTKPLAALINGARDWLLPSGRLREWRAGYRRADIIVVSKCPPELTAEQRRKLIREIDPFPRQRVYFSRYRYGLPYDMLRPDVRRPLDAFVRRVTVQASRKSSTLRDYPDCFQQ